MSRSISQPLIYLIYSGAPAFFFSLAFTVSQIYRIDMLHLNPFQLVLVGTALEISCFIFEIPTGIVADMRSRKLSVIIGLILMGIAFVIEGTIPLFMFFMREQTLHHLLQKTENPGGR
ncbi:MFS transporter [Thermosediminibacter litoriperuensis]|uniref:DHA3 family tetracycline resistance protein-like MFS transporter n=1 Tax=Thermosediminibacter litoriperuensis TaxID=291989 RepID=A0A5S5ART3_9FIRM|nr:MFS transporter [Thermosediminibacter litoriperuensis]TYP54228.1 DHA3 family tetracycline resistance protein-like MFS transporter [Thermosediminibacter litoriperuensis]